MEEQFYLLWPLLVVAALAAGRRWGPRALPAVLAGVVALSLTASVVLTATSPATSYFALHTRAWELGAGALVALGSRRLATLDRRVAALAAWGGLATITASALLYSDDTAFPGAAALLPVLGAVAVVAAGCGGRAPSVTRAVGGRAVQTVGTLSYGWYLWHWPVLLLYPVVLDVRDDTVRNLAVSAGALGLAWVTHRFVERPTQAGALRERSWLRLGAAMSVTTVCLAGLVYLSLPPLVGSGPPASVPDIAATPAPAALAAVQRSIDAAAQATEAPANLTPDVWEAVDDFPPTKRGEQRCMADYTEVDQGACVYGDPDGGRTAVLIGDSHADQWQPAFDAAGARAGWQVVEWAKAACPLMDRPVTSSALGREYTECATWREKTLERIVDLRPDLVVATQSDETGSTSYGDEEYARTTVATLERLRAADVPVVYVQDTHYPGQDVRACLSDHLEDVTACARANGATRTTPRREVLERALTGAGVPLADPTPWQCSPSTCPAVVGNVVVYRDDSHLTATYSRWLVPFARSVLVGGGT